MKFKTKRDKSYIALWSFLLLLVDGPLLVILMTEDLSMIGSVIVISLGIIFTSFLLWTGIDISYEFKESYLLTKAGALKSKVRYAHITKITGNPNLWIGNRYIFSSDAINIHYKYAPFGSVVVSPEDKGRFIKELLKRNAAIQVEIGSKMT